MYRLFCLIVSLIALAAPASAQELIYTLAPDNDLIPARFGEAVAGVPDTDGDGVADFLVGSPDGEAGGVSFAGQATVLSGATGGILYTLASPNPKAGGSFGAVVAAVGDVDGDEHGDFLIGAPEEDGGIFRGGGAYLFSGANGTLLQTLVSPDPQIGGRFGFAVAGVPDTDGDTIPDLLVGATSETEVESGDGRVYLFSGADGTLLYVLRSPNSQSFGSFGRSVSGLPDVDGDGRGDLLIGAAGERSQGINDAGQAYLFSGETGVLLQSIASPNPGLDLLFGLAVASVPDADGDGAADLFIGEPGSSTSVDGRAYLFSSETGSLLTSLAPPSAGQGGRFGLSVAGVADANGDGAGDLLIGAPFEDEVGVFNQGRAYLFAGGSGELLETFDSPSPMQGGSFGFSVAGVADADGDGAADLLVGAPGEGGTFGGIGRAYVFAGEGSVVVTPDVDLTATATSPLTVAAGDSVSFDYSLVNTTAALISGELRAEVRRSDGTVIARLGQVVRGTLQAGATYTGSLTQGVPNGAAPGIYVYALIIETAAGEILDEETFEVTVTASPRPNPTDTWSAPRATGFSAVRTASTADVASVSAYPNPASGQATVRFALAERAEVRLTAYDVLGREVARLADGETGAGQHEVRFNGADLPSGVYVVRLTVGSEAHTLRVTLVR